jgi:uncharacterized protein
MTEFSERGDGSTTRPNPSPAPALQSRRSDLAAADATVAGARGLTLIVTPTRTCNRNCQYCYVRDRHRPANQVMSLEVLAATLTQVQDRFPRTRILWHGGEPSLAGVAFYEQALAWQRAGTPNLAQTNGFGPADVYRLWAQHGFRIGTSLDLPYPVNLALRHEDAKTARRRIKTLNRYFGEVGVISVISTQNVLPPYEALAKASPTPRLKFSAMARGSPLTSTPEQYGEFLVWWIDRALARPRLARVEPIHEILSAVLTGQTHSCTFSRNCQANFLAVDPVGDVYPCNRCLGDGRYRFGNIVTDGIDHILASPVRRQFAERAERLRGGQCAACHWFPICQGGCPFESESLGKDYYCWAYQRAFAHAESRLTELRDATGRARARLLRRMPGLSSVGDRDPSYVRNRDCGYESYWDHSQHAEYVDAHLTPQQRDVKDIVEAWGCCTIGVTVALAQLAWTDWISTPVKIFLVLLALVNALVAWFLRLCVDPNGHYKRYDKTEQD